MGLPRGPHLRNTHPPLSNTEDRLPHKPQGTGEVKGRQEEPNRNDDEHQPPLHGGRRNSSLEDF